MKLDKQMVKELVRLSDVFQGMFMREANEKNIHVVTYAFVRAAAITAASGDIKMGRRGYKSCFSNWYKEGETMMEAVERGEVYE